MNDKMVRVTLEMDLIQGQHFPNDVISEQDILSSATESFIAWLDSWSNDPNNDSLREYIQAKLIYK